MLATEHNKLASPGCFATVSACVAVQAHGLPATLVMVVGQAREPLPKRPTMGLSVSRLPCRGRRTRRCDWLADSHRGGRELECHSKGLFQQTLKPADILKCGLTIAPFSGIVTFNGR